jgi:hypothetical protein
LHSEPTRSAYVKLAEIVKGLNGKNGLTTTSTEVTHTTATCDEIVYEHGEVDGKIQILTVGLQLNGGRRIQISAENWQKLIEPDAGPNT